MIKMRIDLELNKRYYFKYYVSFAVGFPVIISFKLTSFLKNLFFLSLVFCLLCSTSTFRPFDQNSSLFCVFILCIFFFVYLFCICFCIFFCDTYPLHNHFCKSVLFFLTNQVGVSSALWFSTDAQLATPCVVSDPLGIGLITYPNFVLVIVQVWRGGGERREEWNTRDRDPPPFFWVCWGFEFLDFWIFWGFWGFFFLVFLSCFFSFLCFFVCFFVP
jgi:hypothetical protein